jgi:hypothetical protein
VQEKEVNQGHLAYLMKIIKKTGKVYSVKGKSAPIPKNTKQKRSLPAVANLAKPSTIKVVINRCYGGFSLSSKAVEALAKKRGKSCYFFSQKYNTEGGKKDWNGTFVYERLRGCPTGGFWVASTSKSMNDAHYSDVVLEKSPNNRSDPDLVSVVEELGRAANGPFAKLKVVKVPADVDWEICEYDGIEVVSEKCRTWY